MGTARDSQTDTPPRGERAAGRAVLHHRVGDATDQIVADLSSACSARSTSHFVNWPSTPPGPTISSSIRAPASNSLITSSERRSRTSCEISRPRSSARRRQVAALALRARSLPRRRCQSAGRCRSWALADMTLLFGHAYTERRRLPAEGAIRKRSPRCRPNRRGQTLEHRPEPTGEVHFVGAAGF
jgi:hypothetical protein